MISIHALREEGDLAGNAHLLGKTAFLSTPSARRATVQAVVDALHKLISIHALREEGDAEGCALGRVSVAISIHALREEGD